MKRNMKCLLFVVFVFASFSSCKNNEQETETFENVEAQNEAFNEELDAARGNDQILSAVQTNPELSTFAEALHTWNMEDSLETQENDNDRPAEMVVFAPTNMAYSQVRENQGEEMIEIADQEVISYHILESGDQITNLRSRIKDSQDTLVIGTVQGEDLKLSLDGNTMVVTGVTGESARVTDSIEAGNGMVYVIDKVLLPRENKREVNISTKD